MARPPQPRTHDYTNPFKNFRKAVMVRGGIDLTTSEISARQQWGELSSKGSECYCGALAPAHERCACRYQGITNMTFTIAKKTVAERDGDGKRMRFVNGHLPSVLAGQRRWPVRGWVAMGMLAVGLQASPAFAQALSCGAVYSLRGNNASGTAAQIYATANNGAQTLVKTLPATAAWAELNPFGISADGTLAFLAVRTGAQAGAVRVYNLLSNTPGATTATPSLPAGVPAFNFNAGAVNPANGLFYIAGISTMGWELYVYNPATPATAPVRVGRIDIPTTRNNGDIAFDSLGNLYVLAGNITATPTPTSNIYRVGQVPTTPGTGTLTTTVLTGFSPPRNVGGIAFTAAGELMVSSGGTDANNTPGSNAFFINRYNPLTGTQVIGGQVTASASVVNDLASCVGGNTISLRKDLPQGRLANGNQFTLQLSGGGLPATQSATTTGNTSGVQSAVVGPFLALDDTVFTINEVAAGSPASVLTNYARSWDCVDEVSGTPVASGLTFPGSVTMPSNSGPNGSSVMCTITNAQRPQVTIRKISVGGTGAFSFSGTNGIGAQTLTTTTAGTAVSGAVQTLTTVGAVTTITEAAPPAGYTLTAASCTGLPTGGTATADLVARTLTLNAAATAAGANLTCTFTNTRATTLTLIKTVTNDNGGTQAATAWTLSAAGPTNISGTTGATAVTNAAVNAGTYTLSESTTPTGYTAGTYSCVKNGGAAVVSNSIALAAGDTATCTINNNDNPARLTLVKTVTNDNGGTQAATAWTLSAAGPTNISGTTGATAVTNAVVNAGTYTLSESTTPTGYTAGTYSCVKNGGAAVVGNSIALVVGDTATCTINNDDTNQTDVTVTKTASPGTAASGSQVTFTMVVRNLGAAAAHGTVVRDPAVTGLNCTAAGLPAPTCSATGSASCPATLTASGLQSGVAIPALPNGGVVTIGLTCNVTASGLP